MAEPEFLEIGDSFRVNIFRDKNTPKSTLKNNDTTKQNIIEMVEKNNKITQVEISEKLNITLRAVKKSIKELQDRDIMERVGSSRSGYWKVKEYNNGEI